VLPNVGYGFAILALAAIAAFWPSYLSRSFGTIDATTHAHAAVMAAWCALLVVQPFLIRGGRTALHRALGKLSYALAPLVVAAALRLTQVRIQALPADAVRDGAAFFYLPLSATALFGVSYALAMVFRRRPALHARFMVGTALSFVDPVLARIVASALPTLDGSLYQPITFAVMDGLLAVGIWRDRAATGATRAAFPVLLALFAIVELLWFTLAPSQAWMRLVERFGSLWVT
jgi:hypothetical protein